MNLESLAGLTSPHFLRFEYKEETEALCKLAIFWDLHPVSFFARFQKNIEICLSATHENIGPFNLIWSTSISW